MEGGGGGWLLEASCVELMCRSYCCGEHVPPGPDDGVHSTTYKMLTHTTVAHKIPLHIILMHTIKAPVILAHIILVHVILT